MPALNIPERYQTSALKIMDLPDHVLDALLGALNDVSASVSSKERMSSVAAKVQDLRTEDLELILRTLDSFYQVRAHLDAPLDRFVSDVIEALRGPTLEVLPSGEREQKFRSRLTALLSAAPLAVSAKAQVLKREYPNLFHGAKVITDLRPIFGQSTKDSPDGVILDHTLKVVYHEGLGDHKELYLALDSSDLVELKKVIERAEEKEQALRTMLAGNSIRIF
jgi:hypothetical protein